mmetsp:Transcript_37/g.90  ORF Transcript_37/g.90 Transcript_37/m.90 type:complete len:396 (-) Transcript_37:118-1305(-)
MGSAPPPPHPQSAPPAQPPLPPMEDDFPTLGPGAMSRGMGLGPIMDAAMSQTVQFGQGSSDAAFTPATGAAVGAFCANDDWPTLGACNMSAGADHPLSQFGFTLSDGGLQQNVSSEEPLSWKKGEFLGSGAMGQVFCGTVRDTGEIIAVKEVKAWGETVEESTLPLRKEIETMQHLEHPNIVKYLGSDKSGDTLFIYLEYMEGGSLKSAISEFGFLTEMQGLSLITDVLRGVEYLHGARVVHRDIKASNVLLTKELNAGCVAKLADFGCSKRLDVLQGSVGDCTILAQTMAGSIPWMAPEIVKNEGHSFPADIWACGCLLIEMLTGKLPWGKMDNALAALYKIAMSEAVPDLPPGIAQPTEDFLTSALKRDPKERLPATALLAHECLRRQEVDVD